MRKYSTLFLLGLALLGPPSYAAPPAFDLRGFVWGDLYRSSPFDMKMRPLEALAHQFKPEPTGTLLSTDNSTAQAVLAAVISDPEQHNSPVLEAYRDTLRSSRALVVAALTPPVKNSDTPADTPHGSFLTNLLATKSTATDRPSPSRKVTTQYLEEEHNVPRSVARSIANVLDAELPGSRVPLPLVLAVMKIESGFNPGAVSSGGAAGLMQVVPSIHLAKVREVSEQPKLSLSAAREALLKPEVNVETGLSILSECYKKHRGDVRATGACYNGYTTHGVAGYKARLAATYEDIAGKLKRLVSPQR